jgi:hypothetical protein
MKIKKLLLGLAVCLMVVPLAVGLAACGKKTTGEGAEQRTGKFTSQYIDITILDREFSEDTNFPEKLSLMALPEGGIGEHLITIQGSKSTTKPWYVSVGTEFSNWGTEETASIGKTFRHKLDNTGTVNGKTEYRWFVLFYESDNYYSIEFRSVDYYNSAQWLTWAKTIEIR